MRQPAYPEHATAQSAHRPAKVVAFRGHPGASTFSLYLGRTTLQTPQRLNDIKSHLLSNRSQR